jgi:hypothetical protein
VGSNLLNCEPHSGWANLSFTPNGKKTYPFNNAGIFFPSRDAGFGDEDSEVTPEDIVDPLHIRIKSLSIGAVPRFGIGETGKFQGTHVATGTTYCAVNAKVLESEPGDLLLEIRSLDGVTNPVSRTIIR